MSFIKNGLTNIFIYGSGLIIINGLSLVMLPFYTRQFSPAEYAVITLVLTFIPFTRYCLPLEVCQAAPVFSSDYQEKSQTYLSIGLWFSIGMNVFVYILLLAANAIFKFIPYSSSMIASILILLIIDCLYYYTSNILRWQLRHLLYNFIVSTAAILEVCLTVIFVLYYKISLNGVFYSWIISRSLGMTANIIATRHIYKLTFDIKILREMLAFSVPLLLSNIPYNINRSFDRWIVASMIGLSAVGVYSAGATIGGIINFIMASLATALVPFIYKNHNNKNAPVEIVKLFYWVISLCIFVVMFFALFNKELLGILVAKDYYNQLSGKLVVPVIVLSSVFAGLNTFTPGLSIKKKSHFVIWFNLISLIINCGLAFLLIRYFGISGVAIASLISIVTNAVLYMCVSQRFYYLPFKSDHLVRLIAVFFIEYCGGIWMGIYATPFHWQGLLIRSIYWIMSFAVIIWLVLKTVKKFVIVERNEDTSAYNYA